MTQFYCFLAISLLLVCILALVYRERRRCRKILEAVSAEHKLNGPEVTVLQNGYIRMRVDIVAANSYSFKSYLHIFVNVPAGKDAQSTKVTVETINEIAAALHSEGLLVGSRMGIHETDEYDEDRDISQCVFPLDIVVNEKITPGRFVQVCNSLFKAIMDNGCNDIEHFTITGTDTGTVYKHYRGNLCIGMIQCEYGKQIVVNSYIDRPVFFGKDEQDFSASQYNELRDSIVGDGFNMSIDEAAECIRQILKHTGKGIGGNMVKAKNRLSVTISSRKSSVILHVMYQDGLWWIYSYGNMLQLPVLSTESEADVTRMLMRVMTNFEGTHQ